MKRNAVLAVSLGLTLVCSVILAAMIVNAQEWKVVKLRSTCDVENLSRLKSGYWRPEK